MKVCRLLGKQAGRRLHLTEAALQPIASRASGCTLFPISVRMRQRADHSCFDPLDNIAIMPCPSAGVVLRGVASVLSWAEDLAACTR